MWRLLVTCLILQLDYTNAMKVLNMVATHPDYRRQGAASMLLQRGCDIADAEGVEMYVSASKHGASLYAKFICSL